MEIAIFRKHHNGYYTFEFENGEYLVFEEVHPKVLQQFNLKDDENLKGKKFQLTFSEIILDDDEDFLVYRLETLNQI